jgi:uncharacterized membrane protein YbhN (UPF0104 family)
MSSWEADVTADTPSPRDTAARTEEEAPERHLASTIFNLVMMAVGGVFLWWMLRQQSWAELRGMAKTVGWWFAVVLALELVSLCMDAAALHAFMRPEARMISYVRVLAAQASGRAINVLTPGGALGEPTKLTLLIAHAPRARVVSSIVLLNLSMAYIGVAVMLVGTPITLLLIDLPHAVKVTVGIGMAILVPAMIALAVVIQRGAVGTVVDVIRRTGLIDRERAKRWKARLLEVDSHIRELHKNRSAGTWKGILWVAGSKIVTWTSTMLLIWSIGVEIRPSLVIGVLSVGMLIGWVSQIVPMGLGVADGGNYALYGLLGASGAQGLVVTMMSRVRSVTVAILGLGAMVALQIANRLTTARMQRKLRELRERAAAQP